MIKFIIQLFKKGKDGLKSKFEMLIKDFKELLMKKELIVRIR